MYNFALIGCGTIAPRHAENIIKKGRLLAVCDVVRDKADAFSKKFGARAYYNIDELLKRESDVEVVSICTPNGLHAEHSIKALQAGKHVLCEKPLYISSVAGWQMVDTAYFNRKKLFVVMQNRYNEPVQVVKNLLGKKALGSVHSFQINCYWNRPQAYYTGDWKGTARLDGGILYTQFSHFIDLLYWLLGEVETVKGFTNNYQARLHFELEDTGVAAIKMKSGIIGSLHYTINSYNKNKEGSLTLIGKKGCVKIGGQYLNTLEWFDVENEALPKLSKAVSANDYGFYQGSMSNHSQVYDDLLDSLNGNGNLLQAKDAVKTVELIEKIYAGIRDIKA